MRRDFSSLRQGLVGAWCPSLGATGHRLLDRSGRNNHGTLANMDGSQWKISAGNLVLALDGVNDHAVLPTARLNVTGTGITVAAWLVYTTPSTAHQYPRILARESGYPQFQYSLVVERSTRALIFDLGIGGSLAGTARSTGLLTVGRMTHVAASYDGAFRRFYIDGVAAGSTATTGSITTVSNALTNIGTGEGSPGSAAMWIGSFDDIRLYDRALTQQEIRLLASRRGIGLMPVRQRRTSASSRRLYQNVAGTWKETLPLVNVGGTWKEGAVYENVGGTWKN
jgi:hypothetical protein